MTAFIALDKNKHKKVRIKTGHGAAFGENIHLIPVIAQELHKLALEYPVCLIKDNETGQFGLQALLGFEPQENLFLNGNEWLANYVPLHIKRQPFQVGVNSKAGEQPTAENTVVTINMNNSRVQEEQGELLFDDSGNSTAFLAGINDMLSALVNGILNTNNFIKALNEYDLIESVQLKVSFADEEEKSFDGIYTINEEKLKQLDEKSLMIFNSKGYLQACYLLIVSMGNVQKLISLKRKHIKRKIK